MAAGFHEIFREFLQAENGFSAEKLATELARYHHYRDNHGTDHDTDILAAAARHGFFPRSEAKNPPGAGLGGHEKMRAELIASVLDCLKDGRDIHGAMMCGLTACARG
ncbi:MAG: hypothetical protein EA357_11460 [Micavibrio sp.]|nr:MAG: hypothetical protein EA357_11460 [Micavibrio sp.]